MTFLHFQYISYFDSLPFCLFKTAIAPVHFDYPIIELKILGDVV